MTRVLLDTNIFIYREDHRVVPENLQRLLELAAKLGVLLLVHPESLGEIEKDPDPARRAVSMSKVNTYPRLESPPSPAADTSFAAAVGPPANDHDEVDDALLYCVVRNAVDLLVSEDRGVLRKAGRLGLANRVLSVDDAVELFGQQLPVEALSAPPALEQVPVHGLDSSDPIFDSLRSDYVDFPDWWTNISRGGRSAWAYRKSDGELGAILILKDEDESVDCMPPLPRKRRLKICTLKAVSPGQRIGELFVKLAVESCVKNQVDEIYLTHFTEENDPLVSLIGDFGFHAHGQWPETGETVFLKKLILEEPAAEPRTAYRDCYPSFCDGADISKYLVPIRPEYHDRLFIDCPGRQPMLDEEAGQLIAEGNTITKVYLSHSRQRGMSEGDIILFYRSGDRRVVTTLGVVEGVFDGMTSGEEIAALVGNRTVYTRDEIDDYAQRPTKVIFFRSHFHLPHPQTMSAVGRRAPQSIMRISQEEYLTFRTKGGVDARFAID